MGQVSRVSALGRNRHSRGVEKKVKRKGGEKKEERKGWKERERPDLRWGRKREIRSHRCGLDMSINSVVTCWQRTMKTTSV